jgi:hypothetical protein
MPEEIPAFFNKCFTKRTLCKRRILHSAENVALFGIPKFRRVTEAEKCALEIVSNETIPACLNFYSRAVINALLIHAQSYGRLMRRINYCVGFKNNCFGLVQSFVNIGDTCFALVFVVDVAGCMFKSPDVVCRHIAKLKCDTRLAAFPAVDIIVKCLYVNESWIDSGIRKSYLCTLPNMCEID